MLLLTGLAFVAGLAVATMLSVLDRQQWAAKYAVALQVDRCAKADRK